MIMRRPFLPEEHQIRPGAGAAIPCHACMCRASIELPFRGCLLCRARCMAWFDLNCHAARFLPGWASSQNIWYLQDLNSVIAPEVTSLPPLQNWLLVYGFGLKLERQ